MLNGPGLPDSVLFPVNTAPIDRTGFAGEIIGGLQKLNTEEPPGPFGVMGKGPGEAAYRVEYT